MSGRVIERSGAVLRKLSGEDYRILPRIFNCRGKAVRSNRAVRFDVLTFVDASANARSHRIKAREPPAGHEVCLGFVSDL